MELGAFGRHADAIIVAVHILALAPVAAQGMSCGKRLFYADLKHVSPKLHHRWLQISLVVVLQEGLAECALNRPEAQFASRKRATSASSWVTPYRGSDSRKILP